MSGKLRLWLKKLKEKFSPNNNNSETSGAKEKDPNIILLEKELTSLLGLKIEVNHKANNSGNLSIYYKSLDQIQPVLDRLKWKPK